MNSYARRYRVPCVANTITSTGTTLLSRPRLPLRSYMKPKSNLNLANFDATPAFYRSKRLKSRKINGTSKIEAIRKKTPDYTENAYREAVSKLKYLLAESYAPRLLLSTGKLPPRDRIIYRRSNLKIHETPEDSDDPSIVSDCSRMKGYRTAHQFEDANAGVSDKNQRLVNATSENSVCPVRRELQTAASSSELASFIARQEEYIEQLEQESRYCKDELRNMLEKIREVVAENEALHDKNKAGLLKSFLREYESCDDDKKPETSIGNNEKKVKTIHHKMLEGPSIVFESRISELEAQLTQARIELKKVREENQANLKRLEESCGTQMSPEFAVQLDVALREKRELSVKLEEALRSLDSARERENQVTQKVKQSSNLAQQAEFDKYQADTEIRRLNDELDRQREKLREISQEMSKRVAEERHQVERRYSQQVEQLSADVASHWDAASKSQMETDKQRRELMDLRRDLGQKQSMIDELKKELQNKISNLQSDLNRVLAEKDEAEQELSSAKLATERTERYGRQEQNRWQAEVNSYKQRLERADADIVHCRRENLRLSEQIASLEKELKMSKLIHVPEVPTSTVTPRPDGEKDLTTMIMDLETKHEDAVAASGDDDGDGINLTTRPTKKKRTVKVDLKVKLTPKKKSSSSKIVKMPLSAQEEMASLQRNLEYLSTRINDTLENNKAANLDRKTKAHDPEIASSTLQQDEPSINEYSISGSQEQPTYTGNYSETPNAQFNDQNPEYKVDLQVEQTDNHPENYAQQEHKYEGQEYQIDNQMNYPADYSNEEYPQYDQYDPSLYQQTSDGQDVHAVGAADPDNQQDSSIKNYEAYSTENYPDNQGQSPIQPDHQQEYEIPATNIESNVEK